LLAEAATGNEKWGLEVGIANKKWGSKAGLYRLFEKVGVN